ncbi:MAG: hypothetical protein J6X44_12610 [Thermoguttaceae bacterium]|nr:hypothetical protein [Thermoguttaceae bacterium]
MQTPESNSSAPNAQFIFLTCQRGAEPALKKETAKRRPDFRFSYSRPGFVTFKLPRLMTTEERLALDAPALRLIFARSCVQSIGRVAAKNGEDVSVELEPRRAAERVWGLAQAAFEAQDAPKIARLHVYERDRFDVGTRGFEPGLTDYAFEVHRALYDAAPDSFRASFGANADRLDAPGDFGEICLDVAIVERNEFHVGFHRVSDAHSRYPGGLFPLALPTDAASRAFLKFEEGLRWADFPIGVGSRCVDIGASPGGGSQALLARGAEGLGVDPAEIDPRVLANPNFTHLRGKINQLKRKLFRKSRWFLTDMNVAPDYTLDALEEIVNRDDIAARGLLFTLKFFDWKLADNIPEYLARVKSWGFNRVKARQLQFNRQEIMVAAQKKPFYR